MFSQVFLLAAEFLVLLSSILGLYVIALNPRYLINRLVGLLILLFALTDLAVVLAFRSTNYLEAQQPYALLAALIPTIFPAVLVIALLLLRGDWFTGRRRWFLVVQAVLIFASVILTFIDLLAGTQIYYTGITPASYTGGVPTIQKLANGSLAGPIILINVYLAPLIGFIPVTQAAFFDRKNSSRHRSLARILVLTQALAVIAYFILPMFFQSGVEILVVTSIYVLIYAYLTFQQQISERRWQSSRLQPRLILLTLIIALPTLIYLALISTDQTRKSLIENANLRLEETSNAVSASLQQWLDLNTRALQNLAAQPGIRSLDPGQQKPILEAMGANFPYMYLVSTTDTFGNNIARSDNFDLVNYSDSLWFQNALRGHDVTLQTDLGRTTDTPELVASTPIRNENNQIIGTTMFATDLTVINNILANIRIGETGFVYVVDERGYLVSHPGLAKGEVAINEFGFVAPVDFVRRGGSGLMQYRDLAGTRWYAYATGLPNNWVIVAQQQEQELLLPVELSQQFTTVIIGAATLVLIILTWATMRQAFLPIRSLTDTAQAIARGDLKRVAPIESEDEFGTLARSFNSMTAQLLDLIDSLEERVNERTHDLERKTTQLKAATEVGRAVATLHDLDRMLTIVTRLISESFGFYHVGIFLIDSAGEYAVLRAANSEGGQKMLARGHRLSIGQQGIVGYVTMRREPRISLNVGLDSAHYVNPDLPDTRSEIALPLIVGGNLLGALDVQSVAENAFTQQDVETLQVLADQVAIAISNAQLVIQSQKLLESERRAYREITHNNWREFTRSQRVPGYSRTKAGLESLTVGPSTAAFPLNSAALDEMDPQTLVTPVIMRGETIGMLRTRKPERSGRWTDEEIALVNTIGEQLAVALESARSYQETQMRSVQERITAEVTSQIRSSLDLETMVRTATREVRQSLGLPKVLVQLVPPGNSNGGGNGKNGHSKQDEPDDNPDTGIPS